MTVVVGSTWPSEVADQPIVFNVLVITQIASPEFYRTGKATVGFLIDYQASEKYALS